MAKKKGTVSLNTIRELSAIGVSVAVMAQLLGVSRSVLYSHIKSDKDIAYAVQEGNALLTASISKMQLKQAEAGDSRMLVWLGKQHLGQKDKPTTLSDELAGMTKEEAIQEARVVATQLTQLGVL